MRGKWLLAIAVGLLFAVSAHADLWLTTRSTITNQNVPSNTGNLPGPVAGAGSPLTYDSLTGSSLGGVSYTNAFASVGNTPGSRTAQNNDIVHELGVDLFPSGFTLGGPTSNLLNNTNVTAVFAGTGTITSTIPGGGVLAASFQQLVVNIYNRGSTAIDRNDPSTWGVNAANLINQYVLHVAPGGSSVQQGFNPPGFALTVSAGINNAGIANPANGVTSQSFFIIDHTAAGNGPNYMGATPLEVELNELLQQSTQTGVGGVLNQANANAVFQTLFASAGLVPNGGNFFSAPDGATDTSFAPSGPPQFVNGDTVQTAGATVFPLQSTTSFPGVPEPASMLLWGLGAIGVSAYVRRRRAQKSA
jgi:hypothetical protein